MYLFKFIKLDQSLCILETLVLYHFKKTLNVKTKKKSRSQILQNTTCIGNFEENIDRLQENDALSFYVTKSVLVGPKWFWSDQIDLGLTIMIWSQPK